MSSYAGQTALTALWNKVVAVLAGKADRSSVYSKAEVDYKLATTYGLSGGGSGSYVTLSGTETISGAKTFTATGNVFYSQGIKIKSTSTTSYYATIYNTKAANTSVYMPYNSGANYLLGRGSATTTANTIPYYTNTTGGMSAITMRTASGGMMSNSDTEIPTSAAIITYLLSKGVISSP
jgi:hypothetical protein